MPGLGNMTDLCLSQAIDPAGFRNRGLQDMILQQPGGQARSSSSGERHRSPLRRHDRYSNRSVRSDTGLSQAADGWMIANFGPSTQFVLFGVLNCGVFLWPIRVRASKL